MQGGEGGAQRAGLVVVGFCLLGVLLFAVVDRDRSSPLAGAPSVAVADTDTEAAGPAPCGGAAAVTAAVRASTTGGMNAASDLYDVKDVRIASSDPDWGRFSVSPKTGKESQFQPAYGVVQCTLIGWLVNDVGTSAVGCDGKDAPPAAVRSELELSCPS
jgi:hypothetical protein